MDPMSAMSASNAAGQAAGAALRIIGVLIGRAVAQGDYDEAERLKKQALEQYGTLDPNELASVNAQAEGTEFDKSQEDPAGREAQLLALQRMQQLSTGNDPESAAEYARAQQESGAMDRGLRQAALQRLYSRGVSPNSGLAVASQMDAAQQATQQKSMADLQTAADARRRALQAISMAGQMGGALRGDDYRRLADRAAAQDAINRFNAGQRWAQAQATYGAKQGKADRMYGGINNEADYYGQRANQTVQEFAGMGDAAGDATEAATRKKKDDQ